MGPESSDSFGNFIDTQSENAVLFLEESMKLSKERADYVPMVIPELYDQELFV
jgi:hypothetical protein